MPESTSVPAEVTNLAGAAAALGATVDELLDLLAGELEEELAALKLRPLVRRRVQKEWAARQEGAQGEGAATAVPTTKPTLSQALSPGFP